MTDAVKIGALSQEGFEAAVRSYGEWSKGLQALATRITENTKKAFEDTTRTWEQIIGAKSVEQAIEIQSQYAKRAYDAYVAEARKLSEWYVDVVRNATKPFEQTASKVEQTVARKAA